MKCQNCGSELRSMVTDLPFKVTERTIVVIKELPVLQCDVRPEYLLEDAVMTAVDAILARVDDSAELEIVRFAA